MILQILGESLDILETSANFLRIGHFRRNPYGLRLDFENILYITLSQLYVLPKVSRSG